MRLESPAKGIRPYLILLALSAIMLAPVMSRAVDSSDFKTHYKLAFDPSAREYLNHPLFHETTRFYKRILPSEARETILLVTALTFMAPVPLPVFWRLRRISRRQLPDYVLMLLALGLVIMSPITLWTDSKYLLGYFNPVVYHNPTLNALRPFLAPLALMSLMVFADRWSGVRNRRAILIAVSAVTAVLATSAKPSYTIALIPGLCLFAICRYLFRRRVDLALLTFGFVLPACLVLGAQYLSTYVNLADDSSIKIGFLTLFAYHVPMQRIPFQILLSIIFPAAVYLLYRAEAHRDLFLNLSWVVFAVGALISLMFYEAGPRWRAGNFLWTSYSAVFVLMLASLSFLVERYSIERELAADVSDLPQSRLSFRFIAAMLLFGLHIISGLAYYFRTMSEF